MVNNFFHFFFHEFKKNIPLQIELTGMDSENSQVYFLDKKISQVSGDYFDLSIWNKDEYMKALLGLKHTRLHEQT